MTDPIIDIDDVAHGGTSVGRLPSGKVVFVRGTAPGERVRVRVREERAKRAFADATDILVASPHRVAHVWPQAAANDLGGADLGHLSLAGQREIKDVVLSHTLRRIGGVELAGAAAAVRRPLAALSATGASRTRFRTVIDDDGRPAMRKHHSHELVAIDRMPLAVEAISDLSAAGRWPAGTELRHLAPSAGPALTVPVGTARPVTERITIGGEEFRYDLTSDGFWQAHERAPQALAAEVLAGLDGLGDGPLSVLELFAGAGLFTLPLARRAGPGGAVTTVEGSRAAVTAARANIAALAGEHAPVRALAGRIDAASVRRLRVRAPLDAVVLDPPRAGAGKALVDAICARRPRAVVLVSCDPAALARDAAALLAGAYELTNLQPLDLFEHTHHLEVVARFRRVER